MKTSSIVFGALFITLLGVAGCGGGSCSRGPKCSAEPKPTEADLKTCEEQAKLQMSDPCQGAAQSLADCAYANTVCGADNLTDLSKSQEKYNMSCAGQKQALDKCCQANPSSSLCGGGPLPATPPEEL